MDGRLAVRFPSSINTPVDDGMGGGRDKRCERRVLRRMGETMQEVGVDGEVVIIVVVVVVIVVVVIVVIVAVAIDVVAVVAIVAVVIVAVLAVVIVAVLPVVIDVVTVVGGV